MLLNSIFYLFISNKLNNCLILFLSFFLIFLFNIHFYFNLLLLCILHLNVRIHINLFFI